MRKFLTLSMLLLLFYIPYASAHPFTLETNPSGTVNAPVGITKVYVTYSEQVELGFSSLKVFDSNGEQIDNRDTGYYKGEESLLVSTPPLQEGVYTVASKVLSKVDGHLVPDAFVFAVGDAKLDHTLETAQPENIIFFPEAGARFPGLVGQTVVLGAVIASLLVWGTQNKQLIGKNLERLNSTYNGRFMSITGIGLVLVVISNILILAVQAWRLESSIQDIIQTAFGTTWLIRMAVTAILLGVWFWLDRKGSITKISQVPLLLLSLVLISTTTMMGHGMASGQMPAIILDYVHNLVAAIWIGGITFFVFVLLPMFSKLDEGRREKMSLVMIPRFSIVFVIAVGTVIITGPTLMWFLESDVGIIAESTYGKLIMAKIAIAAGMVGLGGLFQFRIQKRGERAARSGSIMVHKRMQRSLKVDVALGVILLGIVAILANGTLPAGEIQKAGAEETPYGFATAEFSENARFDVEIMPFASGDNTILVRAGGLDGNPIYDLGGVSVKVSNPQKNISPIEVPVSEVGGDGQRWFTGEITFGFSGTWQVEAEAHRTANASESIVLHLPVKPRLADIRTEIVEYELPEDSKPLYPLFDGSNSIWISDPSAPRLWKFDLDSKQFESFLFDGQTSGLLAKDNNGNIWFTDAPANQIGFINPATGEITRIGLPEIQPVVSSNIATFIEADREGNVWIVITNKDLLLKYDQKSESFTKVRLPEKGSLPFALAVDDGGNVWFTESAKGRIGYFDPKDDTIKEFSPKEPLRSPEALLFDRDGNLWISEHTGAGIVKFDPVLETFERFSVHDADASPFGMSLDRYGNIWIAQHTVDSMSVYDPDNDAMVEVPIPTATSFVQFTTTDDKDNVWFVEQQGNKLAMAQTTEVARGAAYEPAGGFEPEYTEVASPLIAMGIVATSLFYVKSVRDKRRLNELINPRQTVL